MYRELELSNSQYHSLKDRIFSFSNSRCFYTCYILQCHCMSLSCQCGICQCHFLWSHNFSSCNIYQIKFKAIAL